MHKSWHFLLQESVEKWYRQHRFLSHVDQRTIKSIYRFVYNSSRKWEPLKCDFRIRITAEDNFKFQKKLMKIYTNIQIFSGY